MQEVIPVNWNSLYENKNTYKPIVTCSKSTSHMEVMGESETLNLTSLLMGVHKDGNSKYSPGTTWGLWKMRRVYLTAFLAMHKTWCFPGLTHSMSCLESAPKLPYPNTCISYLYLKVFKLVLNTNAAPKHVVSSFLFLY